jgi:hypothetical protein
MGVTALKSKKTMAPTALTEGDLPAAGCSLS